MKELSQTQFKSLLLINDLGMRPIGGVRSDSGKPRKARFALVRCPICNKEYETRVDIAKNADSCRSCSSARAGKTHGMSRTKLYVVWQGMFRRDYDEYYSNIPVVDEWKNFVTFKDWAMSNGYVDGLTIDRKDHSKGYSPSNCRWTTHNVQGRNTRKIFKHNKSGYRGVSYDSSRDKWLASIKVNNKAIYLGRFEDKLSAAKAYDAYVVINNLEHTINGVLYEQLS